MVHSPSKATYTVSLYAEYGLRDDLTLIAYAPFFQRITLNKQVGRESEFVYFGGDDAQGIAEVGVRYACGAAVPASSVPTWLRLTPSATASSTGVCRCSTALPVPVAWLSRRRDCLQLPP